MSRTGSFGRQPRAAPSLSATIVALAREEEAQRDQNIINAWQKGGEFEGKKVTDELILGYWRDRLKGISKDDPLYDTYRNAILQYEYAIAESKMTARYAMIANPSSGDDMRMVSFYLGWAKKIPKDSELYRVLQRDAGQYLRRAKANAAANAARIKEELYQKQQNETLRRTRASDYLNDVILRMAQGPAPGLGLEPVVGTRGSGSQISNMLLDDPGMLERIIRSITPGYEGPTWIEGTPANPAVLYHDYVTNRDVTGVDVYEHLAKIDPDFITKSNGRIDFGYIEETHRDALAAKREAMRRARRTGHVTDAANLRKSAEEQTTRYFVLASVPTLSKYATQYEEHIETLKDASPEEEIREMDDWSAFLRTLANDPSIRDNYNLRDRLLGEAERAAGTPTVAEDLFGASSGDVSTGTNAVAAKGYDRDMQDVADVAAGKKEWAVGVEKNGIFYPDATGTKIRAVDAGVASSRGVHSAVGVSVPGYTGLVYVQAAKVTGVATNPLTGELVPSGDATLGWVYNVPDVNGEWGKLYDIGTYGNDPIYTFDPPGSDNPNVKHIPADDGGVMIDFGAMVAPYVTGQVSVTVGKHEDLGIDVTSDSNGKITVSLLPQAALAIANAPRIAAGFDVMTDFFSPVLAVEAQRPGALQGSVFDDKLRKTLDAEAHLKAGYRYDPKTGEFLLPDTADAPVVEQRYLAFLRQINSFSELLPGFREKDSTLLGQPQWFPRDETRKGLFSDMVVGTAFDALKYAFKAGTNQLAPPPLPGRTPTPSIKTPLLPIPAQAGSPTIIVPPVQPSTAPTLAQTLQTTNPLPANIWSQLNTNPVSTSKKSPFTVGTPDRRII